MHPDWYALVRTTVRALASDVAEEVAEHLADLFDEALRRGATEEEAEQTARAALHNGAALLADPKASRPARMSGWQPGQSDPSRPTRGHAMLVHLRRDLHYAVRMLGRQPAFASITILTLTLGIGVNVAVFAVMRAALLASMPVPHPEQLVSIVEWSPAGGNHTDFSYPLYVDARDAAAPLADVAAYISSTVGIAASDERERVTAEFTTSNYFAVLGVRMQLGSGFTGADERRGAAPVAVLSDGMWRTAFRSDPYAIGQSILVDGQAAAIVGVAPPGFSGFVRGQRADIWMPVSQFFPLHHEPDVLDKRGTSWLSLVGRMRDGTRREQLQDSLTTALRAQSVFLVGSADAGQASGWAVHANRASEGDNSLVEDLARPLQLLMIAVGLILVITSANVANLLLARSYSRQAEIAVRESLGASRARIIQQLIVEAAVLVIAGAVGALLVGTWVARIFEIRTVSGGTALSLSVTPDLVVVGFTALLAVVAALATGLVPAVGIRRLMPAEVIKTAADGARVAGGRGRLRAALTVVQVALSLVLIVGAGLFLRSLAKIRAVEPSLLTDRTVAATVNTALRGYDEMHGRQFYDDLLQAVRRQPGIRSAALAYVLPVTAGGMRNNLNPHSTIPAIDAPVEYDLVPVSPGFFGTTGLPLVEGRDFQESDTAGSPPVAVINERMKATFWPTSNPVGQRFKGGLDTYTVVGIARDTKYRSLREKPRMVMYLPLSQMHRQAVNLIVSTALPPDVTISALREAARSVDPAMPLYNVRTLAEHVDRSLYLERVRARLILWLATLALALAGVGIYGVVSYTVTQRTREVGIRLALGAPRPAILAMLLTSGARLAAAGLVIGAGLSVWLTRTVESQLYGITSRDPVTFIGAAVVLFSVALVATYIPARRATRIDPMLAVRSE